MNDEILIDERGENHQADSGMYHRNSTFEPLMPPVDLICQYVV